MLLGSACTKHPGSEVGMGRVYIFPVGPIQAQDSMPE